MLNKARKSIYDRGGYGEKMNLAGKRGRSDGGGETVFSNRLLVSRTTKCHRLRRSSTVEKVSGQGAIYLAWTLQEQREPSNSQRDKGETVCYQWTKDRRNRLRGKRG